jgi:hypothetical protein
MRIKFEPGPLDSAPPDLWQRVADEVARMTQLYAGTDTIKRKPATAH